MRRPVYSRLILALLAILAGSTLLSAAEPHSADAGLTIRGKLLDSEIVIQTTPRTAGAIDSVLWRGKEFIDSVDHGRQLQSASNFDFEGKFHPETFNPTEAGSVADGAGPTSTSRLLHSLAAGNRLQTTTQMAFWLSPGGTSAGHPATNPTALSNHLLTKRVTIGYEDLPNVIVYDATFQLPLDEQHTYAQFEAVTGYMPAEFSQFWQLKPDGDEVELLPLSDGPGEIGHPVILATPAGDFAMGVYSAQQPSPGYAQAGYGRFRFADQQVVKWNCVFRVRNAAGLEAKEYRYRSFVALGTLDMVRESLTDLMQRQASGER
jgi:hypothetical protein